MRRRERRESQPTRRRGRYRLRPTRRRERCRLRPTRRRERCRLQPTRRRGRCRLRPTRRRERRRVATDETARPLPVTTDETARALPVTTDETARPLPITTDETARALPTTTDETARPLPVRTDETARPLPVTTDEMVRPLRVAADEMALTPRVATDDTVGRWRVATDDVARFACADSTRENGRGDAVSGDTSARTTDMSELLAGLGAGLSAAGEVPGAPGHGASGANSSRPPFAGMLMRSVLSTSDLCARRCGPIYKRGIESTAIQRMAVRRSKGSNKCATARHRSRRAVCGRAWTRSWSGRRVIGPPRSTTGRAARTAWPGAPDGNSPLG